MDAISGKLGYLHGCEKTSISVQKEITIICRHKKQWNEDCLKSKSGQSTIQTEALEQHEPQK